MVKRILTLGFLVLVIGSPVRGQETTNPAEAKRLQGKWTAVAMEENGKEALPKGGVTIVFKDDKAIYQEAGDKAEEATFKVEVNKSPRQMDLVLAPDPKDKDAKALKILAIYQLDGDTLKICYRLPPPTAKDQTVSERPTAFDSKNGGLLLQLKRAK